MEWYMLSSRVDGSKRYLEIPTRHWHVDSEQNMSSPPHHPDRCCRLPSPWYCRYCSVLLCGSCHVVISSHHRRFRHHDIRYNDRLSHYLIHTHWLITNSKQLSFQIIEYFKPAIVLFIVHWFIWNLNKWLWSRWIIFVIEASRKGISLIFDCRNDGGVIIPFFCSSPNNVRMFASFRLITYSPITSISIVPIEERKLRTAFRGVSVIGSLLRVLKLVFNTMGTPVALKNAEMSRWWLGLASFHSIYIYISSIQ